MTVSHWLSAMPLRCLVEGMGMAGSDFRRIAESFGQVPANASWRILTIWSGSFQSMDRLRDVKQQWAEPAFG